MSTSPAAACCENCGTRLLGPHCHVCAQSAHNPLKSFRHALEDVFESFWHLDGRVFRSLRDLLVPGRISRHYLDGQRVRYVPPLRLYVILSLFAFFIAHQLASGIDVRFDLQARNDFAELVSVADVEAERDRQLVEIDAALAEVETDAEGRASAHVATALQTARRQVAETAEARMAELEGREPRPVAAAGASSISNGPSLQAQPQPAADTGLLRRTLQRWQHNADENFRLFVNDGRLFAERMIAHLPTALLVLVPVFALVLRVVYLLRPIGYLEHLVVALYSHSFLLLAMMAWMLLVLLERAIGGNLLSGVAARLLAGGSLLYLLLAQKRIYGDAWLPTLLRFAITDLIYLLLATLALSAAMAMAFIGGG
ncbi:DUF3667 domain-containing protein [Luteimonas sp. e5]